MRKLTITAIITGILLAALVGTTCAGVIDDAKRTQDKAHEIAELARELGLPESDAIIKRAQELWWEAEETKQAEAKKRASEPKLAHLGSLWITGYDACAQCCGKSDGITASGAKAEVGRTVAMSGEIPFGTRIYIDGLGYYTVEDRGVGRGVVDVFCADHPACYAVTGYRDVWIVEE